MSETTLAQRGFAWARDQSGADTERRTPAERPTPAEHLRSLLPADRERARDVRAQLRKPWRTALDAILRGEERPPVVASSLQRLLSRPTDDPKTSRYATREELRDAIHRIGLRALVVATSHLDRRSAARMARALPDHSRRYLRDTAGAALPDVAAAVVRDAFVRLADLEAEVADRADALGTFVLAFATADDEDENDAIAALLIGRERNRFLDFTAAAKRSSRRRAADGLRALVEGAADD